MSTKGYGDMTLEALGRLARASRDNEEVLQEIASALSTLYSYDARVLRQKVQGWLVALQGDGAAEDGTAKTEQATTGSPRADQNEFGLVDETDLKLIHILERMRERLLDLTNRNPLLSYRHPRTRSLRVVDEVPAQVFSRLLSRGPMTFVPLDVPDQADLPGLTPSPAGATAQEKRVRQEAERIATARRLGIDPSFDLQAVDESDLAEHADNKLQTLLRPHELEKLLHTLHRDSIAAVQESGANMLHLMLGFLEWRDINTGDGTQPTRVAPLVLLPVALSRGDLDPKTRTYRYSVEPTGEDWSTNVTLQVKCRKDFGFELPAVDEEDENLEAYFTRVEKAVGELDGWRLRRFITLGLVSFGKILMWRDLDATNWPKDRRLLENGIFREILGAHDGDGPPNPGDPIVSEYPIDSLPPKDGVHLPLVTDADSSQHSVLVDVRRGRSMVVQGPPGTGKSQTITNLIGDALSRGQKVLFVAEKKAALDVVAKRLNEAGLGPFCLPLHSHTAQKREFLDDLMGRLNLRGSTTSPLGLATVQYVADEMRAELNGYAERLHEPCGALRRTPFDIFWRVRRLSTQLGAEVTRALKDVRIEAATDVTGADLVGARTALESFAASYRRVADDSATPETHPWSGVVNPAMTFQDVEDLVEAAVSWTSALVQVNTEATACATALELKVPTSSAALRDLVRGARALPMPKPGIPPGLPLAILSSPDIDLVRQAIESIEAARAAWAKIPGAWGHPGALSPEQELHFREVLAFGVGAFEGTLTQASAVELAERCDELVEHSRRVSALLGRLERAIGLNVPHTGRIAARVVAAVESLALVDDTALQLRSPSLLTADAQERIEALEARARQIREESERLDRLFDPALRPDLDSLRQHVVALSTAPRFLPWLLSGSYRKAVAAYRGMTGGERVPREHMISRLRELLSHRLSIEEFDQAPALAELLGRHAEGVLSPFSRVLQLLDWRKKVAEICSGVEEAGRSLEAALWNGPTAALRDAEAIAKTDAGAAEYAHAIDAELGLVGQRFRNWTPDAPDRLLGEMMDAVKGRAERLREIIAVAESAGDKYLTIEALGRRLLDVRAAREADHALVRHNKLFTALGVSFAGPATDVTPVVHAMEFLGAVRTAELPVGIQRWLVADEPAVRVRVFQSHADRIARALDHETAHRNTFGVRSNLDVHQWLQARAIPTTTLESTPVEALLERLRYALAAPEKLHAWSSYHRERAQSAQIGLETFCEQIEGGILPPQLAADAYEMVLFRTLADAVFRAVTEFNLKSGDRLQVTRARFAEYDDKWIAGVRAQLAHKLNQAPAHPGVSFGLVSQLTDEALIRREATKTRRHIPIREMFRRAGAAIQQMKPCFLMGPQAVAQYLTPGLFDFDLVVMDEASQMRPEDALGAIARGKQLVVVGDPKQLGPTSFFDRLQGDEDEELEDAAGMLQWRAEGKAEEEEQAQQGTTVLERSESILHAAAARYPTRLLRWHYRSKHPKLIAFSNREFYDENLIIFPGHGGNDDTDGVFFQRVDDGLYEPRAKRNVPEARALVEAVGRHAREFPERSLLVATLNSTQAELIDLLLEAKEKEDPVLAAFRRRHAGTLEPLVVKNLENVQGDERDAIFISVTFGRNSDGQLRQNFGPINQRGGERRLNVLFTRAKHRLDVFCSFDPSDLRVGEDSPRGLRVFQDYLRYAQGAQWALGRESGRSPDSDFEIGVAAALEARGYEVRCQVGVAGFFIDLGVVHPDHPGRFILGVECDGATYHSSKSARDRDRLRELVLTRDFHWALHRIWSTDWFRDPVAETNRAVAAVEARLATERQSLERQRILLDPSPSTIFPPSAEN